MELVPVRARRFIGVLMVLYGTHPGLKVTPLTGTDQHVIEVVVLYPLHKAVSQPEPLFQSHDQELKGFTVSPPQGKPRIHVKPEVGVSGHFIRKDFL
jgi:hypothetical protein